MDNKAEIKTGKIEGERVLDPEYPVFCQYLYVVPDKANIETVIRSPFTGNVAQLKEAMKVEYVKNCDVAKRNLLEYLL